MRCGAGKDGHTCCLTESAEKHELTTTTTFDQWNGNKGGQEIFGSVAGSQKTTDKWTETSALKDGCGVVGDDVDTTDLLEDLIDIAEYGAVEIPVLVPLEAIGKGTLGHLQDSILDSLELVLDDRVLSARRSVFVHE